MLGVDLDSVCGGRGICGRCQVTPTMGDFPKHGIVSSAENVSGFTDVEERYRDRKGLADDRRLGCMALLEADLVVDVPAESQVHRQVVRKDVNLGSVDVDPVVRLHLVEIDPPSLDDPAGDAERLLRALATQWNLTNVEVDRDVLADLQRDARAEGWSVTVAVRDDSMVCAVWPGYHEQVLGVAIDVGSTTVAGHLADLRSGAVLASAGRMNPQIRFGEDLMSRVSYVMMNPSGAEELTTVIRRALDELIGELVHAAAAERRDILEVTLVGNPIMHHLFLGWDPRPLGEAPFALVTDRALSLPTSDLDLDVHPAGRAYVLPCIAGHVGADTAGAILADRPHLRPGVQLLVDVGTNAEIVLGDGDRLLAASSPTGPAFEGAQISSGQRAAPGAIERVRIDPVTLEPRIRVIGSEAWSDDPGFESVAADLGVNGICGSGIIEAVAELFLAGVIDRDGVVAGAAADRTNRVVADGRTFSYRLWDGIHITQNDIRAIQLAKAALYAGVRLLMDHLGVDEVDGIRLAGAFGSHIDVKYAMTLGLIPDCDLGEVSSAGNAAGSGALIALLSGASRREVEEVVRKIEKIETATEPRFQEHFVEAMAIPHRSAPYARLRTIVDIPEPSTTTTSQRRRRTRRTNQEAE